MPAAVMSSQCRPRLALSPARARGRRIVPVLAAAAAAVAAAAAPGAPPVPPRGCSWCPCAAYSWFGRQATLSPLVRRLRAPVAVPSLREEGGGVRSRVRCNVCACACTFAYTLAYIPVVAYPRTTPENNVDTSTTVWLFFVDGRGVGMGKRNNGGGRRLHFLCNLVALFLLGGPQLLLARALLFLLLLPLLPPRLSARIFLR